MIANHFDKLPKSATIKPSQQLPRKDRIMKFPDPDFGDKLVAWGAAFAVIVVLIANWIL